MVLRAARSFKKKKMSAWCSRELPITGDNEETLKASHMSFAWHVLFNSIVGKFNESLFNLERINEQTNYKKSNAMKQNSPESKGMTKIQ